MDNHAYENLSLAEREQSKLQTEILDGKYGLPGDMFFTTRDLAQKRGISVVTAHNVLAGLCRAGYLELRGKRYHLAHAAHLTEKEHQSKILGLLVPKLNNEFFSSLAEAVIMLAKKQDYQVFLMSAAYSRDEEIDAIQAFSNIRVSGIISCLQTPPENAHFYQECSIPCVTLAQSLNSGKISSVQVNSFSISQKVAQHLIDEGYRHFLYIGNNNRSLENDQRFAAFQMILNRQGFVLDDSHILQVSVNSKSDSDMIAKQLKFETEPIGIFCYHDLIAAKVYNICHRLGKRIPEDVGIVGFDDLSVATLMNPPLTTVQYRVETMADMALKLLLSSIESSAPNYDNYYIEPNLVVRSSSILSKSKG